MNRQIGIQNIKSMVDDINKQSCIVWNTEGQETCVEPLKITKLQFDGMTYVIVSKTHINKEYADMILKNEYVLI